MQILENLRYGKWRRDGLTRKMYGPQFFQLCPHQARLVRVLNKYKHTRFPFKECRCGRLFNFIGKIIWNGLDC